MRKEEGEILARQTVAIILIGIACLANTITEIAIIYTLLH